MKRTALVRTIPLRPRRKGKRRVAVLRDPQYCKWLREECLCLACLKVNEECGEESFPVDAIEAAHTQVNGTGSKGTDSSCVPLCVFHHSLQHSLGVVDFQRTYKLDLTAEAARHYAAYLAGETIR